MEVILCRPCSSLDKRESLACQINSPFNNEIWGSGCGAVGRAVAYDTRGPGFDSSHRQLLLNIYLLLTVCRKDKNKEKRPGMAHLFFFKKKQ